MFELKNILKIFLVFTFLLIVNDQFCFALNLSDAFKANDGTDTEPLDAAAKSAGYNIKTARGDEAKVNKAKDVIQNAVIGLIITISAYAIWDFVFYKVI